METKSFHAGMDRYSVAFPEVGITYLAEVAWPFFKLGRWHSHAEHQFLWILDGAMSVETEGQRYDFGAGTVYALPAQQVHLVGQREQHPPVVFLDLRLAAEPGNALARFLFSFGQTRLAGDPAKLRETARQLREALGTSGPRTAALLHAALWTGAAGLVPATLSVDHPNAARVRLRPAEELLRSRLHHPLATHDLAKAAGLSRSQLTRLYIKHFGVGPAERLRQLRVEKACELLRSSTLSVKEIAPLCGFVCPNHFCRVFAAQTGQSPTAYRATAEEV